MIKKLAFAALMVCLLSVFGNAQAKPEENSVKINASTFFKRSKITVRFIDVVEDSRCPPDAACIWAGNAKIKLEVSYKGKEAKVLEIDTSISKDPIVYRGHTITIESLNFPDAQKGKADYTAVIKIEKH